MSHSCDALGCTSDELDTPYLRLDLDRMESNIRAVAGACRKAGKAWRPHAKGHKNATIARAELAAGALGATCAKLGEAEVLAAGQALAQPGDISEPLHTGHGLYLVRLMERREAGRPSANGSDALLHQKLLAQECKRIEAKFSAETRSRARVEINSQALASVQLDFSPRMAHAEAAPPAVVAH